MGGRRGRGEFRFKRFSLRQERTLMPLTTDSVLLGAWVACRHAARLLDVGAGSGAVTLILAQRGAGHITALEPDKDSCLDLAENVSHSPWHERITLRCTSLQVLAHEEEQQHRYDLVVSNPPFFDGDTLPADEGRRRVRHTCTLGHDELVTLGARLLKPGGHLALILPAQQEEPFIARAAAEHLYCNRLLRVRPTPEKPPHRVVMEFSGEKKPLESYGLTIREGEGWSKAWRSLMKDLLLEF